MKIISSSRLLVYPVALIVAFMIGHTIWMQQKMDGFINQYYEIDEENYETLYGITHIEKFIVDMESGVYGYLLTGDQGFLERYYKAKKDLVLKFASLNEAVEKGTPASQMLDEIQREINNWISKIGEPNIGLRQMVGAAQGSIQELIDPIRERTGEKMMDRLRTSIDQFKQMIKNDRNLQLKKMVALNHQVMLQTYLSVGIMLLFIIILEIIAYRRARIIENTNAILADRENRLQYTIQQLEEASRLKSQFVANMSHELRTPLNAIIGFAQVLQKQYYGPLTEKQLGYVNYILSSGHYLLDLINDILDLSKIEAGKMDLDLSTFSLKQVLENGLLMVKEKALKHRLELSLEVDPEISAVTADEKKLKQIVYNLLSNAVKFTPDGGKVRVRARMVPNPQSEAIGGFIEISVADTGIGIPPLEQEKIFEPFTQLDGGYSRKYDGTGLGLYLVKKLVELHGGRVWVKSEGLGKGSTFYFTLPLREKGARRHDGPHPGRTE